MLGSNQLVASAQENEFTITLNPGATNRESQNPMSPSANITITAGTNVTWINNDISPHMLVSGTPEEGPDNIFYGSFFGAGENYTVTFDEPGLYSYYDPVSNHLRGIITVENPGFSSDQGLNIDTSSAGGTDDNIAVGSNTSDFVGSSTNNFNVSDGDIATLPSSSSSSLPSFPSFSTDNTTNQSSILSSIVSDQTLKNIIKKVGPLIGILMGGSDSSSPISSHSPLSSSFSQSNESFGVSDTDNQSSFFPSTTQSSESHHTLANIFNKIGPLLSLLMNGNNSSSDNMNDGQGLSAFFSNDTSDTYDNSSSLSATNDFGTSESTYAPS
ncbi:MAG TPA: plastocyanin/azurin family copper-binding protein [Candidatus Nitrosocosmicus sp.]|nr:plastocyanin/azurin family copper-binding protein [Candidatus Nitrosocosmicus sp.]